MGTKKDYTPYREQLIKDWNALLKEYNVNPFEGQDKIPEKYRKPYNILYSVFVLGYSIRKTAELAGLDFKTVRDIYVQRYISVYEKYALLGEIPSDVNILKEAFGGRKKGRPRKDYKELAKTLKQGNPLLWQKLIQGLTTYRVRGKDEKPIFHSVEKLRKIYAPAVEGFLGVHLNQKDLWARFIDEVVRLEFGAWWKLYASVLPYKLYMKFVESKRAKNRKLPEALGFAWEYTLDITEITPDLRIVKEGEEVEKSYYVLAASDTYSGLILGWRIKPKEKGKSYNDAFDKYDVGLFLKEIFEKWGIPRGIKTDRGKNFLAEYVKEALELLGVEHLKADAYAGWQKKIERIFGEVKDWLLSPEVQELEDDVARIERAFELYNETKQKEFKSNYATYIENKEEVFAFAFLHKEFKKVNNGYISVVGVKFFVGHLIAEYEDGKLLGRGRKKKVSQVLVAIHPENLTKAWIYIPAKDGLPYEGKKWKLLGVVNADTLLPADERTLTGKAKKQRKKRALKKKAEKLYKQLDKIQGELIEESKPTYDELDELLLTEKPEEEISEEILFKEETEEKPQKVNLPQFNGPGSVWNWIEKHFEELSKLQHKDKVKLVGIIQRVLPVTPALKRDLLLKALKKLEKEVKAHA